MCCIIGWLERKTEIKPGQTETIQFIEQIRLGASRQTMSKGLGILSLGKYTLLEPRVCAHISPTQLLYKLGRTNHGYTSYTLLFSLPVTLTFATRSHIHSRLKIKNLGL